ncbi:hypothetical protein Tco_0586304 [Tanacetum coccineum]
MCTYLKNMEGKKLKDLKNKSFDSIQKMFDRAFKRVNTFVDIKKDLVEGSSKRAGEKFEQESTKKQKLKSVDREDLVELYKLVKAKYGSTRLVEDMDLLLWGVLKTMFEPHVEDEIWKLQQRKEISPYATYNYRYVEQEASVNAAERVNAVSEEVSTAELVSTAYLKEFDLLKWDQHICFLVNMNVLLLHLIERKDENKRLDHLKQESYFSAGNGAVFIDRKTQR